MDKVSFKPEGYNIVNIYITVDDAKAAIDLYTKVFDGKEIYRIEHEGSIMHAELQLADMRLMLSEEWPDYGVKSPKSYGGSPMAFCVYVPNVDAIAEKAKSAGFELISPLQDQFYGDRSCKMQDPFGHVWTLATHIEDVSIEEIQKRALTMFT